MYHFDELMTREEVVDENLQSSIADIITHFLDINLSPNITAALIMMLIKPLLYKKTVIQPEIIWSDSEKR
jgi:hypothetical protein